MLLAILAEGDAEEFAELPREVMAVAEAHLKRDIGHTVFRAAEERGSAIHTKLDEMRDWRTARGRPKAPQEIALRHVGDRGQLVEGDRFRIGRLQVADGFADAEQGARVRNSSSSLSIYDMTTRNSCGVSRKRLLNW
jgi:hypothetical protein